MNITRQTGKRAVDLFARFFQIPTDVIRAHRDEIEAFASLHEIEDVHSWPKGSVEYDSHVAKRLLLSTVLHMDASVYLMCGDFYGSDPTFTERCHLLLEERLREGCAIVHADGDFTAVGRHCHEAIWLERGKPTFRGRLGEVAKFAASRPEERRAGVLRVPARARLLGTGDVHVGPDGGMIEIEFDVFASGLELALVLRLVDEAGRQVEIQSPEPFAARDPGIHEIRIALPAGLLGDGTYEAKLLAVGGENGADGEEEMHDLVAFDIISHGSDGAGASAEADLKMDEVVWNLD